MTTDRYAVAGHPVTHSRSPWIHARFAALTGEAVDYGRLPCPLDGFSATVREFAARGAKGCHVTVPLKFEAPALCVGLTPRAALARHAARRFLDPDDPIRREALRWVPAITGYGERMTVAVLDRMAPDWTAPALRRLLAAVVPGPARARA